MENELFMNVVGGASMTSPSSSSPAMPDWVSLESSQQLDQSLVRGNNNMPRDCFFWEKSTEQSIFDSALSSLVSSPTPSNSNFSGGGGGGESFVIRELIGKLGNIGEIYGNGSGTPMSSPPPRSMLPATRTTPLAEFSGDPGFAERAARFSCFGSRSFNGRTNPPLPFSNGPVSTSTVTTSGKLTRVSSTPSLKSLASPPPPQIPAGKPSGELSRKRKAKSKETSPKSSKEVEEKEDSDSKKSKKSEENGEGSKSADPYKDFIHVRARRGQATDSHSLAERVRREKIGERMKLLQDLVPGCNKVTGKALMLDEIINYVQSLQRQVEFLSMKLSSVNTRLDFNMDTLVSKDIFPSSNNPMHQQILQLECSSQQQIYHNKTLDISSSSNIVDPSLETSETRSFMSQLPSLTHFTDSIPQYPTFSEDDLHSMIQMGFPQNHIRESNQVPSHNFQGPSNQGPSPYMKADL